MAEENQVPEGQENTDQPVYTKVQLEAMEQGWKPKEQFEGEEDTFVDAPEFVRRGELFKKIEHQSKELKAVKQALDALKTHNSRVEQAAYDRALKSLQETRRAALVEGETEKAFQIEDQIEDVKKERERVAREASVPAVQELNPEFVAWQDKNTWYTTDKRMRAVADTVGVELARQGLSPSEVLKRVVEEVKDAFPHKFTNPAREKPSNVEPTSRGGSSQTRGTDASMSEDERSIMRKIVATGVMTEAEYRAQLKKAKE